MNFLILNKNNLLKYNYFFRGISLVEVIIAISILAFSLGGLAAAVRLMTSNGQLNLRHHAAYNEANVYLQQILQLSSEAFLNVFNSPSNESFRLITVTTDNSGIKSIEESLLNIDVVNALANQSGNNVSHANSGNNTKDVVYRRIIDQAGNISEETFQMQYTVYVTDLNITEAKLNAYLVVLSFEYEIPTYAGTSLLEGRAVGLKTF